MTSTDTDKLLADLDKVVTVSESAETKQWFRDNGSAGEQAQVESHSPNLKAYRDRVQTRSLTDAPERLGYDPGDKRRNPGSGYDMFNRPIKAYFDSFEECAPSSDTAAIQSVRRQIIG